MIYGLPFVFSPPFCCFNISRFSVSINDSCRAIAVPFGDSDSILLATYVFVPFTLLLAPFPLASVFLPLVALIEMHSPTFCTSSRAYFSSSSVLATLTEDNCAEYGLDHLDSK